MKRTRALSMSKDLKNRWTFPAKVPRILEESARLIQGGTLNQAGWPELASIRGKEPRDDQNFGERKDRETYRHRVFHSGPIPRHVVCRRLAVGSDDCQTHQQCRKNSDE